MGSGGRPRRDVGFVIETGYGIAAAVSGPGERTENGEAFEGVIPGNRAVEKVARASGCGSIDKDGC